MSHDIPEHSGGVVTEAPSHVVPLGVLLGVFAVLLSLTFLTVAATWFDFGGWALAIALGIATVKAARWRSTSCTSATTIRSTPWFS